MGYPMTYRRVVRRNHLEGSYTHHGPTNPATPELERGLIAGDLRRLEADSRDDRHLKEYAASAGITPEQAKKLLDAFFGDEHPAPTPSPG